MKFLKALLAACESSDADLFAKTVQDYQKYTPLDKVCTKLVVKAKMRYCPEQQTAIDTITKDVNFVDGDSDDDVAHGKPVIGKADVEDYDFT